LRQPGCANWPVFKKHSRSSQLFTTASTYDHDNIVLQFQRFSPSSFGFFRRLP
jgi:hypothetical protein